MRFKYCLALLIGISIFNINLYAQEHSDLALQDSSEKLESSLITQIQPRPAVKSWSLFLAHEILTESSSTNNRRFGDKLNTTAFLWPKYSVSKTSKIGLRQYFTQNLTKNLGESNHQKYDDSGLKQSFTAPTFETELMGILGSEKIRPLVYYFIPNSTAEKNSYGKKLNHYYGQLRSDFEINWLLGSQFSISYYISPRQTFGGTEAANSTQNFDGFEATSRILHYAVLYYSLNDTHVTYVNSGLDHRLASERLTSTTDSYVSTLGYAVSLMGGKLILNPEINSSVPLKANGQTVSSPKYYRSNELNYFLTTIVVL